MRRLALLERSRETPEEEFLLAAGDAGAHHVHDHDRDVHILTFDDKESAENFRAEHLPDSVKVWRDQHEGGDRFVMEVDAQTAREAFTPEPDDYTDESVREAHGDTAFGKSVKRGGKYQMKGSRADNWFVVQGTRGVDYVLRTNQGKEELFTSHELERAIRDGDVVKVESLGERTVAGTRPDERYATPDEAKEYWRSNKREILDKLREYITRQQARSLTMGDGRWQTVEGVTYWVAADNALEIHFVTRNGHMFAREGLAEKGHGELLANPHKAESLGERERDDRVASTSNYRHDIVDAMAKYAYASAWADAYEDAGGKFPPRTEIMDVAPPPTPEAKKWAEKTAKDIERLNKASLDELLNKAMEADGTPGQEGKWVGEFAYGIAMPSLGHGVHWFDNHADFPLELPHNDFIVYPDEPEVVAALKKDEGTTEIQKKSLGERGEYRPFFKVGDKVVLSASAAFTGTPRGKVGVVSASNSHDRSEWRYGVRFAGSHGPVEWFYGHELTRADGGGMEERTTTRLPRNAEVVSTVDGKWIVLFGGFQKGGKIDRSGAGDAEFDSYDDAVAAAWKMERGTFEERVTTSKDISPEERVAKFREIVQQHQHAKVDGVGVDAFSASAVVQVYDQLSPPNQAKYAAMPAAKMVNVAWKLIGKTTGETTGMAVPPSADEAFLAERGLDPYLKVGQRVLSGARSSHKAPSHGGDASLYGNISAIETHHSGRGKTVVVKWDDGKETREDSGDVIYVSEIGERTAKTKPFGGWEALAKITAHWGATVEIPLGAGPNDPYKVIFRNGKDAAPFIAAMQGIGIGAEERYTPTVGSSSKLVEVPRAEADAKAREVAGLRPSQS